MVGDFSVDFKIAVRRVAVVLLPFQLNGVLPLRRQFGRGNIGGIGRFFRNAVRVCRIIGSAGSDNVVIISGSRLQAGIRILALRNAGYDFLITSVVLFSPNRVRLRVLRIIPFQFQRSVANARNFRSVIEGDGHSLFRFLTLSLPPVRNHAESISVSGFQRVESIGSSCDALFVLPIILVAACHPPFDGVRLGVGDLSPCQFDGFRVFYGRRDIGWRPRTGHAYGFFVKLFLGAVRMEQLPVILDLARLIFKSVLIITIAEISRVSRRRIGEFFSKFVAHRLDIQFRFG